MDDPFDSYPEKDEIKEIKDLLENNDAAAAAAKIQEYLDEQNNIPLNIAVTGESGSGKSTFVNVFRGINNRDEGAAPTGCVETTSKPTPYAHPNYPNVTLWDLPGIGTINFPADEYLNYVGFEKFDFFIIISADRFRENDVKLALEIERMKKKFYFVRSKIDSNLRDAEEDQRDFNEERTLAQIRENCIQGLQKQGFESPQVFLVSSRKLHLYDFHLLEETLERELSAHKRNALLFVIPSVSRGIIDKKKDALQSKIKYLASISALIASAPVPGLSIAVDLDMMVKTIKEYQVTFGLDNESLENLARSARLTLADLRAEMTSPLAATEITKELITSILHSFTSLKSLMKAEEGSRYIPLFGIPAAMTCSFIFSYNALNTFLNMLADDAQRVFTRALGLNTTV
ncbi:interferon-inducible GTPase 5-like [Toxotes jaculatrix]|uniref:interferon-inducible GTPase 5-like n=1 Tax=Toxotes jaculatrix TaxID=941984 RepID=UPI001B3AC087|nr:interferon-inducible GTPase 5-like [Toxotes jaculatrix]XP_040915908.1 interferon-inducible GTPase 5-like [Toxotes jaculatrix]XP_040915909.1 interferon-inducible GTPase 5-like [Toxotes jaculatrix]XP_040915910.1 interferon-inducible GTPase 5-like [Toxotes jaculatrix]XP_040915911.1 interferon-inducible GTPase 5-like [Toxotes jaculatrix]XP_040915912.1 interferon-inducible GTPase 5-like [Toxotes jaculatrix]XP_040915913.1 interferon-inducible GTPase 5-like [Toxotes jaculatrix]